MVIPGQQWEPDWEAEIPENNKIFFENDGTVLIAIPTPKPEKRILDQPYKRNFGHPPGNKNGIVHRGKKWDDELNKKLIEYMQRRELVELPMPYRARAIKKMEPDPFPDRTAIALVQHYKQITTPAQRAAALVEAQKPPVQRPKWEYLNSRQEKYSLIQDGLKCTAIATFEKGSLQRISACITPQTEGNTEAKGVIVNELPIDVIKLLYSLVEQLQQEPT